MTTGRPRRARVIAVVYRPVRPEEQERVFAFWVETFGVDREQFRLEYTVSDPRVWEQTRVAVDDDGGLVAAVTYLRRQIRDADGRPRAVGGIYTMATRPDARRRGHGRRLMNETSAAMRRDGCAWSLLSTSEDGRSLYESLGWRTYRTPYRQGTLSGDRPEAPEGYAVRFYDPLREPAGWTPLAAIYDAFNARRPLTVVRDAGYWRGYAGVRYADLLTNKGAAFLVASRDGAGTPPCGYALAWFHAEDYARRHFGAPTGSFGVSEIGALPGEEGAIPALLAAVADHATAHRTPRGRIQAPREPWIDASLERLFGETLHDAASDDAMARPLGPGFDAHRLDAMFNAPGAIFWPNDGF